MSDPNSEQQQENVPFFAQSDEEATERFSTYKSRDPYPDIIPALLNSADIYDYVAVTGMIHPFEPDKLKSASYAVPMLGKYVYWDEDGQKVVDNLTLKKPFSLKKNSIAFVTLEPFFQIPDYIALRFNLKITHVYRGILLGTGPLVDPGFVGRLSIPLHNLTANDYTFRGGDDLIWMEFTKLSPHPRWAQEKAEIQNSSSRSGKYIPFPARKKERQDIDDYLHNAGEGRAIRSSIPDVILNAKNLAEQSAKQANKAADQAKQASGTAQTLTNRITLGGIITGIAVLISLSALGFQIVSLVQDSSGFVHTSNQELQIIKEELEALRQELEQQKKSDIDNIELLENKLLEIENKILDLENKILDLENK